MNRKESQVQVEIRIQGSYTKDHLKNAELLHFKPLKPVYISIAGFIVGASLILNAIATGGCILFQNTFMLGGMVLLFSILFLIIQKIQLNKTWKHFSLIKEPFTGIISEEKLILRSEYGQSEIPWEKFYNFKNNASTILVFQSHRLYNILPRDFFASEADWTRALEIIQRKVRKRKGGLLPKILVGLILILIIFLGLLKLLHYFYF